MTKNRYVTRSFCRSKSYSRFRYSICAVKCCQWRKKTDRQKLGNFYWTELTKLYTFHHLSNNSSPCGKSYRSIYWNMPLISYFCYWKESWIKINVIAKHKWSRTVRSIPRVKLEHFPSKLPLPWRKVDRKKCVL